MSGAPADLVYVSDAEPGITRRRCGRGFSYIGPDGTTIARGPERKRLDAMAIPPAYEDVWMCPLPNGHLQATGRDARRRKQYRYHPDWTEAQARTKFDSLVDFGTALPRIRRRVRQDLQAKLGAHEFALASALTLIDKTGLRVGHPDYTRENGSYGALTLKQGHISLEGDTIRLAFRAKGGKRVRRRINDKRLARVLGKISDLPGAEILSWVDEAGQPQVLSSQALNAYLAQAADVEGITAKTFRTWKGTLAAFEIGEIGGATIKAMAEAAASQLNNTPAIARKSYIHPAVIDLSNGDAAQVEGYARSDLSAAEGRLLRFLEAI